MTQSRSLPKYKNDVSDFAGDIRSLLFSSQDKAAAHFHLHRSTVTRYESGKHKPPIGYLACLARLLVEHFAQENEPETLIYQQALLDEVNQAVRYELHDTPFKDWADLTQVAEAYLAEQQQQNQPDDTLRPQVMSQNFAASGQLEMVIPAQAPALPHFYVERPTIQDTLLEKIRQEQVRTLVLWGTGGTGKSTLAAWLARATRTDFPDGQSWLEFSDSLEPEMTIAEAQAQLARSFGVMLNETSLAERAGQLRTLLSDKQCLVILDNVGTPAGLTHLQVVNDQSKLLITTRYRKVADVLEAPLIRIAGMTGQEGLALLTRWAEDTITHPDLVERLGGLPLALKLSGVQLREGRTPEDLLAYLHQHDLDLSQLDLDQPQSAAESLNPCFDQSFNPLASQEQSRFAQLGCFTGKFEVAGSAEIWAISSDEAYRLLRRLHSLALVERKGERYQLHPLLRAYARQKLVAATRGSQITYRRHAAHSIRRYLAHPHVLDEATGEAPNLDESWPDIIAGVKWAAEYAPQLAAIAVLLAHTERAALVEAIGSPLIQAVETYLAEIPASGAEPAVLHELLGDGWLLSGDLQAALDHFEQAATLWQIDRDQLASSRVSLRIAGLHLLRQDKLATAEALHQAQARLAQSWPIADTNLEPARWLFYWFDLIYSVFMKWGDLALLEKNIVEFVDLAQQTRQPLLEARGWHIYRLFYTTKEVPHPPEIRQKGRQFAAKAAWLWWQHAQKDKALAEVMWTQEQTKGRRSQRMARHFARRLSQATPKLSHEQIRLIKNHRVRQWLEANEAERVEWLVKELPPPGQDDWPALADILSIGTLGEQVRRVARGLPRPEGHFVSEPIWKTLTGQRALPLAGEAAAALVERYQTILEAELR